MCMVEARLHTVTQGPRPVSCCGCVILRCLVFLWNWLVRETPEMVWRIAQEPFSIGARPGSDHTSHSVGPNLVTGPHQTAREAGNIVQLWAWEEKLAWRSQSHLCFTPAPVCIDFWGHTLAHLPAPHAVSLGGVSNFDHPLSVDVPSALTSVSWPWKAEEISPHPPCPDAHRFSPMKV